MMGMNPFVFGMLAAQRCLIRHLQMRHQMDICGQLTLTEQSNQQEQQEFHGVHGPSISVVCGSYKLEPYVTTCDDM